MSKFHINKHGIPSPCRAQKGNCPYGGEDNHFDTQEEAQEYANKLHAEEFGVLRGVDNNEHTQENTHSTGEICENCNGYGYVRFRNGGDEDCPECDGEGMIWASSEDDEGEDN